MSRMPTVGPTHRPSRQRFIGQWNITKMQLWDREDLDLLGSPHLTLDNRGHGVMRFLAIEASIEYRATDRDGVPAVELSFERHDEGTRISGRGWGVSQSGTLCGWIFFHEGDDSAFTATRRVARRPSKRR
jgi:hypothetical protein